MMWRRRYAEAGPHRLPIGIRHRDASDSRVPSAPPGRAFIALIVAGCLLAPILAKAGEISGAVSLASQLVDRGLGITPPTPAVQGAVSWTSPSGWSLGVSGGEELRSPGHVVSAVARVARSWALSENWRMQAGVLYYHYAGRLHANVYEPGVYWTYRDLLTFGLSGLYLTGADEHKLHPAADLNFHWPLAGDFSVSGGIGVSHYAVPYGRPPQARYHSGYYRYGQVGLLWSHGAWRVELDRVVVGPEARRYLQGRVAEPWLATISRSF